MSDDEQGGSDRTKANDGAVDYPAAHSMDTTWFAIDLDGNVAVFDTGESGCVPEAAYVEDPYELEERIRELPANGFKLDPDGFRETQWADHVDGDDLTAETEIFMFVSDLVPVKDLLDRLDATPLESTSAKCVRITGRDRAAFAELHARAACLGCYRDWSSAEDIATHGVYRYEHTCENWIAGPYARATVPSRPLTLDQVPKAIRDAAIAFDGRFAETPKLQPAEHWSCSSWESGWLSSDGKTARPFADHVDDWTEFADNRADAGGEIEFLDEPLEPPRKPKARWWK